MFGGGSGGAITTAPIDDGWTAAGSDGEGCGADKGGVGTIGWIGSLVPNGWVVSLGVPIPREKGGLTPVIWWERKQSPIAFTTALVPVRSNGQDGSFPPNESCMPLLAVSPWIQVESLSAPSKMLIVLPLPSPRRRREEPSGKVATTSTWVPGGMV